MVTLYDFYTHDVRMLLYEKSRVGPGSAPDPSYEKSAYRIRCSGQYQLRGRFGFWKFLKVKED